MAKLILLRHGQSSWNLENRFTGWVDVPLSPRGEEEAREAGFKLKGFRIDVAYTSVLTRAIETLRIATEAAGLTSVPTLRDPALNERMYGDLQGLNKAETAARFGDEQVHLWRRSYEVAPPAGESLRDTAMRTLPYFRSHILTAVKNGKNAIVVAHGNSLRALVMDLERMTGAEIAQYEIATGIPFVYDLDHDGKLLQKTTL
ncbi:MAG TPA: 2,3-diphosphoglycerate-dependent phosphoglycerate mutase [Armatimonadota bacterium]|nr:2,3-diphosphoglycerate-dependent phosphoglycerate mutase [Armatimonadota bacterium]